VGSSRCRGHAPLHQRARRSAGEQRRPGAQHDGREVQRQRVDQPGDERRADGGAAAHEDYVEVLAAVVTNVQSRSVSLTDSGGELITTTNAGLPTSPAP